jgi:diaminopimelate epimerase
MLPFSKYHALGNDYLVYAGAGDRHFFTARHIEVICHRNFGLGSDGILWGPLPTERADFGLRIFNPDGSEAEKSGNGLRIFARYLFDIGRVSEGDPFTVDTPGGVVRCVVLDGGARVTVDMGRVSFQSAAIPMAGPAREVINETLRVAGVDYTFCAATIGNPHCVLPLPAISRELACAIGPQIEHEPRFPRRTNVQLLQVIDRAHIRIEIWERGAGYTLASGSSSSAAGAVARRLGLVDGEVTVHMPGGIIELQISDQYDIVMTGGVTAVGSFLMDPAALHQDPPR